VNWIARIKYARDQRRLARARGRLHTRVIRCAETALLEERIPALDDRAVQLLIRDTDPRVLSLAASGASGAVIGRILDNLPNRGQMMFIHDVDHHARETVAAVVAAQGDVLAVLGESRGF
jgi:hypothetical protein